MAQAVQSLAQKIQQQIEHRNANAMEEKGNKGVGEKRAADSSLTGHFSIITCCRFSLLSSESGGGQVIVFTHLSLFKARCWLWV
jgi:hypothetical protein